MIQPRHPLRILRQELTQVLWLLLLRDEFLEVVEHIQQREVLTDVTSPMEILVRDFHRDRNHFGGCITEDRHTHDRELQDSNAACPERVWRNAVIRILVPQWL